MQLVLYVSSFLPVVKAYEPVSQSYTLSRSGPWSNTPEKQKPREENIKAELRTPGFVNDAFGGTQRADAPKEQFGRNLYDRAGQVRTQSPTSYFVM